MVVAVTFFVSSTSRYTQTKPNEMIELWRPKRKRTQTNRVYFWFILWANRLLVDAVVTQSYMEGRTSDGHNLLAGFGTMTFNSHCSIRIQFVKKDITFIREEVRRKLGSILVRILTFIFKTINGSHLLWEHNHRQIKLNKLKVSYKKDFKQNLTCVICKKIMFYS